MSCKSAKKEQVGPRKRHVEKGRKRKEEEEERTRGERNDSLNVLSPSSVRATSCENLASLFRFSKCMRLAHKTLELRIDGEIE